MLLRERDREREVPAPAMTRILEIPIPLCIAIAMAREKSQKDSMIRFGCSIKMLSLLNPTDSFHLNNTKC